ncbi:MAG TPA: hypothetical protein VFN87_12185 [Solirubrobacteraceae bacterium]|nr:hypothetical protein [Solirubrobacteraceae bacterium]
MTPKGCFRPRKGVFVSYGPVRVNGMLVKLPYGGTLTLDYTHHLLSTSTVPDIQLADWMPFFQAPGRLRWFSYKPTFFLGLPFGHDVSLKVDGLEIGLPKIELDSDNAGFGAGTGGATQISLDVQVPPMFGYAPVGAELSGTAQMSNGNGFQLMGELKVPLPVLFGPFMVKDLEASFDTTQHSVEIGGTLQFPPLPTPLSPVSGAEVTLKAGLARGRFVQFSLAADNINEPVLVPGFFLQRLHLALGSNTNLTATGRVTNTTLSGGGGGSFGPQISKESWLYKIFQTQAFISLDGDLTFGFPTTNQTWYMIASGTGKLLNMQMADAGVEVQGTGAIDIWGNFTLGIAGYGVSFEVPRGDGWYDHGAGMQLHGYGHMNLPGIGNSDAEVLANQAGVTACQTTDDQGDRLPVGQRTGYHLAWGASFGRIEGSCDLSPLARARPAAHSTATTAAPGSQSVSVPRHVALVEFAVQGAGAPPKVTLSGPHAERLSTPADLSGVNDRQFMLIQDPTTNTTHVAIRHPAAGTWTITPQPGSVPVTSIGRALGLPAPKLTGRISCQARCVLRYRLKPIAGQRVVLSEVGAGATRQIATITRPTGTVRFAPEPGDGGIRQIVADVLQNGSPRAQLTVARFRVRSAIPARPRRLHARILSPRRKQASLAISWQRVPGAGSYTVSVHAGRASINLATRTAHARLSVPPHTRLTVQVSAVNTLGDGPPASLQVTPHKKRKR